MGVEKSIIWREFREEVWAWLRAHPEKASRLLREAMRQYPFHSSVTVTEEARWASRWARAMWAQAGLEPPGPPR